MEALGASLEGKTVRLGFILLPSDASKTRFELAKWNSDTLHAADLAAEEIVRRIRKEVFWPPTDPYPYKNFDDHAAILQQGVFGREEFSVEAANA